MTPADYARACRLLSRRDPILGAVIRRYGSCGLRNSASADHFAALVRSIISQQLSTKAAFTIHSRLVAAMPGGVVSAATLAAMSDDQFRALGVSRQKALYLRDLGDKIASGRVVLDGIERLDDEEVIATLTAVKGIGRWTAEMFLMFRLYRPDVLPVGDLGIVTAVQKLYRLRARPTAEKLHRIGEPWKPYRSIACWYLWRSLENEPVTAAGSAPRAPRRKEKTPA